MPKTIDGVTYYAPAEAARMAGISKPTLLRWIEQGRVADAARRDRNDWRMFSEEEVSDIKRRAEAVSERSGRSAL